MALPVKNNPSNDDWICTQTRGDHIEFNWTIKKFHSLPPNNRYIMIESEGFPKNSTEQWKVQCYPYGFRTRHAGWISVFVAPVSNKMLGIKINCEISMIKLSKVLAVTKFTYKFGEMAGYGISRLIKTSDLLMEGDPTDSITICCKIDVLGTYITSSSEKKIVDTGVLFFEARKNRLSEDLGTIFELTDFTIICGDETFPAHKAILASRSTVFAAMFRHEEVEENVKNELKIDNIESVVVEAFLEFIYTDNVVDIEKLADGLLVAADQYALDGLKNLCEETLCKTLNDDNAAELLAFADLHNAHQLKKYAMQYVVANFEMVTQSEAFTSTKLSEELLKEIMRAVALKASEKSAK